MSVHDVRLLVLDQGRKLSREPVGVRYVSPGYGQPPNPGRFQPSGKFTIGTRHCDIKTPKRRLRNEVQKVTPCSAYVGVRYDVQDLHDSSLSPVTFFSSESNTPAELRTGLAPRKSADAIPAPIPIIAQNTDAIRGLYQV